jgi:hypothetical protein
MTAMFMNGLACYPPTDFAGYKRFHLLNFAVFAAMRNIILRRGSSVFSSHISLIIFWIGARLQMKSCPAAV